MYSKKTKKYRELVSNYKSKRFEYEHAISKTNEINVRQKESEDLYKILKDINPIIEKWHFHYMGLLEFQKMAYRSALSKENVELMERYARQLREEYGVNVNNI